MVASNNDYSSTKGRFLFADHTLFDENENFIETLKAFVSLSLDIIKVQREINQLHLLLNEEGSVHKELIATIDHLKGYVSDSMQTLHKKYGSHETTLDNVQLELSPINLLFSIKNNLNNVLTEGKRRCIEQADKYNKYIQLKIINAQNSAVSLLQRWLSYRAYSFLSNFQAATTSKLVDISVDTGHHEDRYTISLTIKVDKRADPKIETGHVNSSSSSSLFSSSVSFSFLLNTSALEFWNHERRVSDLGIKNLFIPIGLKTPRFKKLKKKFTFISGDNTDSIRREPEFVNIDRYHIVSAKLDNKILSIMITDNPSRLDEKLIKIEYDFDHLYEVHTESGLASSTDFSDENKLPRIDYIVGEEGQKRSDLLKIREVLELSNITTIMQLGKLLADKVNIVLKSLPSLPTSNIILKEMKVDYRKAIAVEYNGGITDKSPHYDEQLVMLFLDFIASVCLSPIIRKLKQKSPVKGELILLHEIDNRKGGENTRREYVLRTQELDSQLSSSDQGKRLSNLLGLCCTDDSSDKNTCIAMS